MVRARLEDLPGGRERPGQLGDLNVREAVCLRGRDDPVQLGRLGTWDQKAERPALPSTEPSARREATPGSC